MKYHINTYKIEEMKDMITKEIYQKSLKKMHISIISSKITRKSFGKKLHKKLKKPDDNIKESETIEKFIQTLDNKNSINYINLSTLNYEEFISLYETLHKRKEKFVMLFTEENRPLESKPGKFVDIYDGTYNRSDYPVIIEHVAYYEIIVTYRNEEDIGYRIVEGFSEIPHKKGSFITCLRENNRKKTIHARENMVHSLSGVIEKKFCEAVKEEKEKLYGEKPEKILKVVPKYIIKDCIKLMENRFKEEGFIITKKRYSSIIAEKRVKNNLFIESWIEFIQQDCIRIYIALKAFSDVFYICYDTTSSRQETHFFTDLEVRVGYREETKKLRFTPMEEIGVIMDVFFKMYHTEIMDYYLEVNEVLPVLDYYIELFPYGSNFR